MTFRCKKLLKTVNTCREMPIKLPWKHIEWSQLPGGKLFLNGEKSKVLQCTTNVFVVRDLTPWTLRCTYNLGIVINRYGNIHLTDTDTDIDMLIITDADTDKKETNSPIPIPIRSKGIHRYQCRYRYEKLLDTDTDTNIF